MKIINELFLLTKLQNILLFEKNKFKFIHERRKLWAVLAVVP